jgi:hypothetical protein
MANITKMLTYSIPDEIYSTETTLGKTSTQMYNGPSEIVLWVDKTTGYVEDTWAPEEEPDYPLAMNLRREILRADTDENTIKIALLYGGLEPPKIYEVAVGPADQPNAIITDPSDIRMVFNDVNLPADYTAPLQFATYDRDRSWDGFLKEVRNSMLSESDGRIAEDMPESIKAQWRDYRQKLRDMPENWGNVPGYLVRFPLSPDQTSDPNFDDPEVSVIMIADRTDADNDALGQLPANVN